jgi:hypothetical protein
MPSRRDGACPRFEAAAPGDTRLRVDTTDGYEPDLAAIIDFVG